MGEFGVEDEVPVEGAGLFGELVFEVGEELLLELGLLLGCRVGVDVRGQDVLGDFAFTKRRYFLSNFYLSHLEPSIIYITPQIPSPTSLYTGICAICGYSKNFGPYTIIDTPSILNIAEESFLVWTK